MGTIAALWGSRWLVYVLVPFLALGSYRVWLWQHDSKVAAKTEAAVVEKVKEKADANVATSDKVRARVAAGKRGTPDPNRIRNP